MEYIFLISTYIIYLWIIREYSLCFLEPKNLSPIQSLFVWVGLFCINLFLFNQIHLHYMITFLLQAAAQITVCRVLFQNALSKIILLTFIGNIIASLFEVLTYIILVTFNYPDATISLAGSLLSKLAIIIFIKLIAQKTKRCTFATLPLFNWFSIIIIPVTSIAVIYIIFLTDDRTLPNEMNSLSVLAALLLLFINISIFTVYGQLSHKIESEKLHLIYVQQLHAINNQIRENKTFTEHIRREQHDFKNTVIYIQQLAKESNCEKISEYLNSYLAINDSFKQNINTGNPVMDSLLNYKCNIAHSKNIDFITHLEVPTDLPYNDDMLCIILGNALDNAIEAQEKVSSSKYIDLSMYYKKECLCIIIKNPFEHNLKCEAPWTFRSTKNNTALHGIGLSSIKNVLNKMHGEMIINTDNSIFTVRFFLFANS